MGLADVLGPDPGGQAVDGIVGGSDHVIIQLFKRNGGDHGPKDLFLNHLHMWLGLHQHSRFNKVARATDLLAAGDGLRALGNT